MTQPEYQATLSIQRLMKMLWLCVAALIGIHVVLTVIHYEFVELPWYLRQIFDVDEEDSFPTWYSASALLLTSGVLWVQARQSKVSRSPLRWHWLGLAIGFLLLSVDEIAGVHETFNSISKKSWSISWAVPGAAVAALVGLIYLKFLFKLDRRTAVQFVIGGAVFVGGAVGVELFTERYLENQQLNTLAYNLWNALEEGMEMSGVLIFLQALLRYMKLRANGQRYEVELLN